MPFPPAGGFTLAYVLSSEHWQEVSTLSLQLSSCTCQVQIIRRKGLLDCGIPCFCFWWLIEFQWNITWYWAVLTCEITCKGVRIWKSEASQEQHHPIYQKKWLHIYTCENTTFAAVWIIHFAIFVHRNLHSVQLTEEKGKLLWKWKPTCPSAFHLMALAVFTFRIWIELYCSVKAI